MRSYVLALIGAQLFGLYSQSLYACTLPILKIPDHYLVCVINTDCVIYADACRSCSNQIVINKRYQNELSTEDYKLRNEARCNPACEACSTQKIKVECKNKKCQKSL